MEKLWNKIKKGSDTECWPWTGCIQKSGTGEIRFGKITRVACAVVWELMIGPIPENHTIRPNCGTKSCCNPKHLVANKRRKTLEERFWEKVDKKGPDECWDWPWWQPPFNAGMIWDGKKMDTAPRVSYILANGPFPKGTICCHKCNRPQCVNPNHLYAGTPRDNTMDSIRAGTYKVLKGPLNGLYGRKGKDHPSYGTTHNRGEGSGQSTFKEKEIHEIRQRYKDGEIIMSIARSLKRPYTTISAIVHRKTWFHI